MSYYETVAAQLQSRLKRRGNAIAVAEMWKRSYHAMNRLKDFRATKEELAELRKEQYLDKDLLKLVHATLREERSFVTYFTGVL